MKKSSAFAFAVIFALANCQLVGAAGFTAGDLTVVLAGDGTAALGSAATAAFLREYTISGSLVQTINLPTVFLVEMRR